MDKAEEDQQSLYFFGLHYLINPLYPFTLQIWEKWTPEMDKADEEEEQGPVPAGSSAPKEVLSVSG